MLKFNLWLLLTQNSLKQDVKTTLPILIVSSLVFFLIFRKITLRFLQKKKFLSYTLFRSFYLAVLVFSWYYSLFIIVLREVDRAYYKEKAYCLPRVTLSISLSIFFLVFIGFLTSAIKNFLLHSGFSYYKFEKKRIQKIAFFFYFSLWLWFLFFVASFFLDSLQQKGNLVRILLINYTLWCFVSIMTYALYTFSKYYSQKLEKRKVLVGHMILKAMTWPSIFLLLTFMAVYTISSVVHAKTMVDKRTTETYRLIVTCFIIFSLFRFVSLLEHRFLASNIAGIVQRKTMVQGLGNAARIILILIFLAMIWSFFSEKGSVLALGTALGGTSLGLTFAAKPVLENYFSGLVIFMEGSLKVGDWIYFTNGKIEGVIEYIGPRSTTLRTPHKRVLYVPNKTFSEQSFINASKMTHRRILQKIPVGWITKLSDLDKIIQEIRLMVYNHPGIDKEQALMVHFTGFGTYGLEITIYALTKTKNWHTALNVQENILRQAKGIIETHGGHPPLHVYTKPSYPTHDLPFA